MTELAVYLGVGALAGLIAGLLGVGGGLLIVPLLAWTFRGEGMSEGVIMHISLGTSLATIVMTSLSSLYAHHRRGAVVWPVVGRLAPGLTLGALVGAWLARQSSGADLADLFGLFEMGVALYMFAGAPKPRGSQWRRPHTPELIAVGGVIGAIASLLGIGGGTLTVPYLSWRGLVIQRAVAVSAACGLPIALAGAVGYLIAGWGSDQLPPWSSGFLYWPAFLGIIASSLPMAPQGARLAHYLPVVVLKRVFALLLFLMGLMMLL